MAEKALQQMRCWIRSSHQITLTLEDENSLVNGNLTVNRRLVGFSVEFRIVRLIVFEDVVDGGQQHSRNSDNRFLVATAFFEIEVADTDFRIAFPTSEL